MIKFFLKSVKIDFEDLSLKNQESCRQTIMILFYINQKIERVMNYFHNTSL